MSKYACIEDFRNSAVEGLCRVYYNVHKDKLSVQKKVEGRWVVVGHTDSINLINCTFKVSEKGRQRVIKSKVKNVHAFVEGTIEYDFSYSKKSTTRKRVYYNPYNMKSFTLQGGDRVNRASRVLIVKSNIMAFNPET